MGNTAEHRRLRAHRARTANWKNWGPYLSERAWGTVREDYSEGGTAWDYLPHDHARSRTYRWNEDGLGGISDRFQYLCFSIALWNGRDPILKERLFGLNSAEGNHGEDVKEIYYYLDSTPTHSYMKMLYRYPQGAYPYELLVQENGRRGPEDPEFELLDTGIFDDDRFFDVTIEYAKADENDILIRITAANCGPEPADLILLPTLWFRNTWIWGYPAGPMKDVSGKPALQAGSDRALHIQADHPALGRYHLYAADGTERIFTENETNSLRLFGTPARSPYVKDAFHRYVIQGDTDAVNPEQSGTKAAVVCKRRLAPDETWELQLRLCDTPHPDPFEDFGAHVSARKTEADEFYSALQPAHLSEDDARIQRQAFAGMLWSKQLYYFDVEQWLEGDPGMPAPPAARNNGRNRDWRHLNNFDILSMPDKWEYPWYAAWDLAFHCVPLALLDPDFAKRQLVLLTREWYMHPNGQLPAYEWAFGDVNPPVHAWAAWRVYRIDAKQTGTPDRAFLQSIFHKLLLNFTWWVNRKDADGNNVFQGGFLGLDNISIFDRSAAPPKMGHIDQSDGTAWMGFYSLGMMRIALELAKNEPVYEDLATKFYEHFLAIAVAMTGLYRSGQGLWDEEDGFFYDVLHLPHGDIIPLKVRSLVGLLPLIAVEVISDEVLQNCPDFTRRMHWMAEHRPHLSVNLAMYHPEDNEKRHIFSILTPDRLRRILQVVLDENEFLSPFGLRSLSKVHRDQPFHLSLDGNRFSIDYQPAESRTGIFGGNSNWRGPVWFPLNFLIIEALGKFASYFGEDFRVEFPAGSGETLELDAVAQELSKRMIGLFRPGESGRRPVFGDSERFRQEPRWRDYLLFYEYFHGDDGRGLGASHQTGWTGLVANLLQQDPAP